MKKGIRWGILGPGKIAITFAEAVNLIGEDVIVAVASHDERKAAAFAAEHQIAHGYGSYEELVSRDDIDAVYVSNLHMMHRDAALMAMRHGKAVLCEKPMAINAASARAMAKAAGENHVFLMEAMWSRFLPATVKALELAGAGRVGDIRVFPMARLLIPIPEYTIRRLPAAVCWMWGCMRFPVPPPFLGLIRSRFWGRPTSETAVLTSRRP